MKIKTKAVVFDLDDTLFDHRHSMRTGLSALQKKYECFSRLPLDEFERDHMRLMNEIHFSKILSGEIPLDEGRRLRFKRAFDLYGFEASDDLAEEAANYYRSNYVTVTRLKPGSLELLKEVKKQYNVGIATNNLIEEQERKLDECGIGHLVDVMVTSEEAGVTKPEPGIFNMLLEKLGCWAANSVMIGDSWDTDIIGAHRLGFKCIWINTYNEQRDTNGIANEISSFEDINQIMRLIG